MSINKAIVVDRSGARQERIEWHRVVAFGKLADNCERLLSKGRQVYVEGRLRTRRSEAKDANGTRDRTEIVAVQMRVLGNRENSTEVKGRSEETVRRSCPQMVSEFVVVICFSGATRRIRTDDLLITNA
jgi:single stranded DNA-binding protein